MTPRKKKQEINKKAADIQPKGWGLTIWLRSGRFILARPRLVMLTLGGKRTMSACRTIGLLAQYSPQS